MALVPLRALTVDNGACVISLQIEDTTRQTRAVIINNQSTGTVRARAVATDGTVLFDGVVPAGQQTVNIPNPRRVILDTTGENWPSFNLSVVG